MFKRGDIDIDFADRTAALAHLKYVSASARKENTTFSKHASGVYFTSIPHDVNNWSTIDYKEAEKRGYYKIDFLNMSVYEKVRSEEHLIELLNMTPPWHKLLEKSFCEQLAHIGNYHWMIRNLKEPINSIPRLMMFISLIRPGKKHLAGKTWKEIAKTIWDTTDDGYSFKKSHACAYSHLIVVQMNLLVENEVVI